MVAIYREWAFEEAKSPACRAGAEGEGEIMRSLNPIASAIDTVVNHIEKYVDSTAWDTHHQPSEKEKAERRSSILAVASKLRALSDAAEIRTISSREFDALISDLFAAQFSGVITEDLVKVHEAIAKQYGRPPSSV